MTNVNEKRGDTENRNEKRGRGHTECFKDSRTPYYRVRPIR